MEAIPIAVDVTKVSPPAENLEPPKSAVRNVKKSITCVEGCMQVYANVQEVCMALWHSWILTRISVMAHLTTFNLFP